MRREAHRGQVAGQRDVQPFTLTFSPLGNLVSPINIAPLDANLLAVGVIWSTQEDTRRTYKLCTERPQPDGEFKPRTFLLGGNSNLHTTVPTGRHRRPKFRTFNWLYTGV